MSTTELSYLEFHNTKHKLASGYYKVTEADGDISFAKVTDHRIPTVKWLTEDEYSYQSQKDKDLDVDLMDSWDRALHRDSDEFNRIQPEDLAEVEYDHNHNSELFDQLVYGIEPDDLTDTELNRMREQALESNQNESEAFNRDMVAKKPTSLADLLRAAMTTDYRGMTDEQYAEHCEIAEQNRRDGVDL